MSVSLGLRYETQNHLRDWANLAPRLAIAWSPGKQNGKTVLRAGFGIFYDRVGTQLSLNALRYGGGRTLRYLVQAPASFPAVPAITQLQSQGAPQNLQVLDQALRAPYIVQAVAGFDRRLPKNTTISVNFSDSHGVHTLRNVNANAPLPGSYANPIFPLGAAGPVYDYRSDGILNQYQLITSLNSRLWRRSSLFATYILGEAKTVLPAPLAPLETEEIRRLAVACYRAVDCEGMARVDFLMESATGKIYINEINTIPGFTSISMYPKMWEAAGVPFGELLGRLIGLALERHRTRQATRYSRHA